MAEFCLFPSYVTGWIQLQVIKTIIIMSNWWVWAWNQKPWGTDIQRQMHCGKDAEVKSRRFEPHYPQPHGRPGLQMTCVKRGHLFISQDSFIKKKKKNLEKI